MEGEKDGDVQKMDKITQYQRREEKRCRKEDKALATYDYDSYG